MFPRMPLHPELVLVYVLLFAHCISRPACCQDESSNGDDECKPKSCGHLTDIRYPFWLTGNQWERCGVFQVTCDGDGIPVLAESYEGYYSILSISYDERSFTIRNRHLLNQECPIPRFNISVGGALLTMAKENRNLSFVYGCNASLSPPEYYPVLCANTSSFAHLGGWYEAPQDPLPMDDRCEISVLPVLGFEGATGKDYKRLINGGFRVQWTLEGCTNCSVCESVTCHKRVNRKIVIGITAASGVLLICAVLLFYIRQQLLHQYYTIFSTKSNNMQNIETFLEQNGYISPLRFKYSELKRMTKSFHEKLGQGGYGTVFRGTLQDGRLVAVKMLNSSKGIGEEFVNEVASIAGTSHVNIVRLLGFCIHGHKRALVYEFMSNGSLDRFIYSDEQRMSLGWKRLQDIAVGIARGLEYLHRGCNTRIVHFDIKPHNILLDDEFCPKISDFGLAKLCSQKNSIFSVIGARGTIGYIAPEIFHKNLGVASTKSDVYSYGMVILEMVGTTKDPNAGDGNSSEAYFPQWIYKQLEKDRDLQASCMTIQDSETAKKLILVGLWCIQTVPANRPSIRRVIEMLEGKLDDIELPPQPSYLSPRSLFSLNPSS